MKPRPPLLNRAVQRLLTELKTAADALTSAPRRRRYRRWRQEAETAYVDLAASSSVRAEGTILVDGMWDNANYWLRYSLLRTALGLNAADEVGLLGRWRADEVKETFKTLGFRRTVRYEDFLPPDEEFFDEARERLAPCRGPEDILSWSLPHDLPAHDLYDGLLKWQRNGIVELDHPRIVEDVAQALAYMVAAERLLDAVQPTMMVVSHTSTLNTHYGPLVWQALRRGVDLLVPHGNFGVLRFYKVREERDLYRFVNCPDGKVLAGLPEDRAASLMAIGEAYLSARLGGRTDDLASVYAYQRHEGGHLDRAAIREHFGWDDKLIIGVYSSTWYDNPHVHGMSNFRDFVDWALATFEVARENPQFHWLFKAHPCDEWYGGLTLKDVLPETLPPHVGLVPSTRRGEALFGAMDALTTIHGTAGVEFTSLGKPVLIADQGWFHDCGIAKWSRTREEYLETLATRWWEDMDLDLARRNAVLFTAMHYCRPDWMDGFCMPEDSQQEENYQLHAGLLRDHPEVLERELAMLREWFASESTLYHTYKMLAADRYDLPNIKSR